MCVLILDVFINRLPADYLSRYLSAISQDNVAVPMEANFYLACRMEMRKRGPKRPRFRRVRAASADPAAVYMTFFLTTFFTAGTCAFLALSSSEDIRWPQA